MTIGSLRRVLASRPGFAALAGVLLLVSHDAVFLVQVGPGEGMAGALRGAAHGYWGVASLALASAGALTGLVWLLRLERLRRRARHLGADPIAADGLAARAARAWAVLFAMVAIGFLVQENLEHFGSHGHVIGLGALGGPEYPLAVPVIGFISLLGGLLAAASVRAEEALIEGIARVLARLRPPRTAMRPPLAIGRRLVSVLADGHALRAPPSLLLAKT